MILQKSALIVAALVVPTNLYAGDIPQMSAFAEVSALESDIKAFCVKKQVTSAAGQLNVIDSTARESQGIHFQSIRFEMRKNGSEGQTDCIAEREIIQVVDHSQQRQVLFDSGFYDRPYCSDPVRFSQAPIVYEMTSIAEATPKKRKLAVIEFVSTTSPCPGTNDVRYRRFLFLDMADAKKVLLDIQADFFVPEYGNNPNRIHLMNVSKVFQSVVKIPVDQVPVGIELKEGLFKIILTAKSQEKNRSRPAKSKKKINK